LTPVRSEYPFKALKLDEITPARLRVVLGLAVVDKLMLYLYKKLTCIGIV
jgi:hypothetical protein